MTKDEISKVLLSGLTEDQKDAVSCTERNLLVVAGAGSGKTEVMARRISWWIAMEGVTKESIVVFTFTEKAAKEIKYRVRKWISKISSDFDNNNLGGMYIGTIHGFCLKKIREYWPDEYHNYDILDESARSSLINRGFYNILGLKSLKNNLDLSQAETINQFTLAYDQLHEHNHFSVTLSEDPIPIGVGKEESNWCAQAELNIDVGNDIVSKSFSVSAARYYSYLRCRRFLDFSTSQTEFLNKLRKTKKILSDLLTKRLRVVVDEMQDTNPIQLEIINELVGKEGYLTIVGDHRQAIYGFRGAKVKLLGNLWSDLSNTPNSKIQYLRENFRSTPRIIAIANSWADSINPVSGLGNIPMNHGNKNREDAHNSHIAMVNFDSRKDEATWIAKAIKVIAPSNDIGASHDSQEGETRGITFSDIAVLVRSTTDVQIYMRTLQEAGIPSIVRAGPDLFSQPEVLLFLSALSISAGIDEYLGSIHKPKSIVSRVAAVLESPPFPLEAFRASAKKIRESGIPFSKESEDRLLKACRSLRTRIYENKPCERNSVKILKSSNLKTFLTKSNEIRRVFPQTVFHWLLNEASIEEWDTEKFTPIMFHLGSLSSLITGLETPGWTNAEDFHWQILSLIQYGSKDGRDPEQPLLVHPNAVTISTIHGVKGLEFPAVFLADVCSQRFPSSNARKEVKLPFSGSIIEELEINELRDNENYDDERRLMYVALTRAERFLIISNSGNRTSRFVKELRNIFKQHDAIVTNDPNQLLEDISHAPVILEREFQLSTSFSELRYYLACPHDFYLRRVLGFAPTIDQAFGYGRGVHNLMREIHSNPKYWGDLSLDSDGLEKELRDLIKKGLFYLRYTTGEPAENMRSYGMNIVKKYINMYSNELSGLEFEPEKEFETIIELNQGNDGVMITGAIDIVRKDNPPQVTLIDFKSGNSESDSKTKLDKEEMKLQLGIYAYAAAKELEYIPEKGLVRYLDIDNSNPKSYSELSIPLNVEAISYAKQKVVETAKSIRDRHFFRDPIKPGADGELRCKNCDFLGICGMEKAITFKQKSISG